MQSLICEVCEVWSVKHVKSDLWSSWSLICQECKVWSVKYVKCDQWSSWGLICEECKVWSVKYVKSNLWSMQSLPVKQVKPDPRADPTQWQLVRWPTHVTLRHWSGDQPIWHCATPFWPVPRLVASARFDGTRKEGRESWQEFGMRRYYNSPCTKRNNDQ